MIVIKALPAYCMWRLSSWAHYLNPGWKPITLTQPTIKRVALMLLYILLFGLRFTRLPISISSDPMCHCPLHTPARCAVPTVTMAGKQPPAGKANGRQLTAEKISEKSADLLAFKWSSFVSPPLLSSGFLETIYLHHCYAKLWQVSKRHIYLIYIFFVLWGHAGKLTV